MPQESLHACNNMVISTSDLMTTIHPTDTIIAIRMYIATQLLNQLDLQTPTELITTCGLVLSTKKHKGHTMEQLQLPTSS